MKQGVRAFSTTNDLAAPSRDRLHEVEAHHRALDARLKELGRRTYLTPNEQLEAAEIKKRKLQAKDEMAELRRTIS
jgi:uncharacterized protein YdcH (DUF465 family)